MTIFPAEMQIRHLITLFATMLISTSSMWAQKGFYMGFAGNATASFILNQNTYGIKFNFPKERDFQLAYKATVGYGGSLKIGYHFSQQWGIEVHAGYQSAGLNYEDTDQNNVVHRRTSEVDYITFAIPFRYTSIFDRNKFKQEQKVRLGVIIGPQFGILVNGTLEYSLQLEDLVFDDEELDYPNDYLILPEISIYDEVFYETGDQDDKDFYNSFDMGLLIQVGVDIYPKKWFYIQPMITSYIGLTDMNADAYRLHENYGASRNFNIGLTLGMGFYINQ